MPFPCRAVSLGVQIVPFPFDLHSVAMFNSHVMPCPCRAHAIVKATSQGHGTQQYGHGMACT
jgi:hypothetical protein